MKKILSRKLVSVVVMIAFFSLICSPAYTEQAQTDQPAKAEKQEKVKQSEEKAIGQETKGKAEAQAEAEVNEYYSRDDANVIEDEGYPGGTVKKFPWLLVVGGAIVVGAAVYFLVLKKPKYDLAVTVGEGVTGTPVSGTYKHKKGTAVSYNYSAQTGYADLSVKVDGAAVPASGSITMDKNKTLTATATKVATLIVNSNPTGAQILLDGVDSGQTTNHTFTFTSGGAHTITLRKVGYKEYNTTKNIALGDTETVNKTLEKGLNEYFNSGATSSILWLWQPRALGGWGVAGGTYTGTADLSGWNYSFYNLNWASTKYTVTVRMNRSVGSIYNSNSVLLAQGGDDTNINGYLFNYTADGWFSIWKYNNSNWFTGSTTATPMKGWTPTSKVNDGLAQYNELKIVRNGSTYTYYINGQFLDSFTDTLHNPTYVFIGGYCGGQNTQLNFDYVLVSIDDTAGSVAAQPIKVTQTKTDEHPGYHK